jgi:hypothetical protein
VLDLQRDALLAAGIEPQRIYADLVAVWAGVRVGAPQRASWRGACSAAWSFVPKRMSCIVSN